MTTRTNGKTQGPSARGSASGPRIAALDEPAGEIVGIRKTPEEVPMPSTTANNQPTPLDGVNHPLPVLTSPPRAPVAPLPTKTVQTVPSAASPTQFRFTSAVDLPSREEIQRREKEKLVVTGTVKGPDGIGIASVLVYLTDEEGRRVGQSARTREDTGEFKVIAHESGRYVLKAYKRGFMAEHEEAVLPIESGRIDGYTLRMVPEGCTVKGRISDYPLAPAGSTICIRCTEEDRDFSRSASVDASGGFRIDGIQSSAECFLEIVDASGRRLARSSSFSTRNRKEVVQNMTVSDQSAWAREEPAPGVTWNDAIPKKDKPSETPHLG